MTSGQCDPVRTGPVWCEPGEGAADIHRCEPGSFFPHEVGNQLNNAYLPRSAAGG